MRTRWRALAGCVVLTGCLGGQTGDEGNLDGEGTDGQCVDADPILLELDEVSPLGFSGSDLWALAEGRRESTLRWSDRSPFPYGPEAGVGALSMSLTSTATQVRYIESHPRGTDGSGEEGPQGEIGFFCPARLELDARLSFQTQGGALDEQLEVTLHAYDAHLAQLSVAFDVDNLGGSLAFELPAGENIRVHRLALVAGFYPDGSAGSLEVGFEQRTDDALSDFASPPLLTWPAENECASGRWPVPLDGAGRDFSGQAALDAVNALGDVSMGARRVSLSLSYGGGGVCANLGSSFGDAGTGDLFVPATLDLASAADALSLSFPVGLRAEPDDQGRLARLEIQLTEDAACERWDGDAGCGFDQVDLTGFDRTYLELMLTLDLTGAEPSVGGSYRLIGETRPDCLDNPPEPMADQDGQRSSAGCPGPEQEAVQSLDFGT